MGDPIAAAVLEAYGKLKAKGKPQGRECGIVAGLVHGSPPGGHASPGASSAPPPRPFPLQVVALGTGSGCLSADKLQPHGRALHDGHAEVICRRAFTRYLMAEAQAALSTSGSASGAKCRVALRDPSRPFHPADNPLHLPGDLHLFVTQRPCGDCCVLPQTPPPPPPAADEPHPRQEPDTKRRRVEEEATQSSNSDPLPDPLSGAPSSPPPSCSAVPGACGAGPSDPPEQKHTGARRIVRLAEGADPPEGAVAPANSLRTAVFTEFGDALVGAVRNKPGRGPLSTSVSCSDKICRWLSLGMQGTLLSCFFADPIRPASLTLGEDLSPAQLGAVSRSLRRAPLPPGCPPVDVHESSVRFDKTNPEAKAADRLMCGFSLGAWREPGKGLCTDVTVSCTGYPAGVTKKAVQSGRAVSALSPLALRRAYLALVQAAPEGVSLPVAVTRPAEEGTPGSFDASAKEAKAAVLSVCPAAKARRDGFFREAPFSDWVLKDVQES